MSKTSVDSSIKISKEFCRRIKKFSNKHKDVANKDYNQVARQELVKLCKYWKKNRDILRNYVVLDRLIKIAGITGTHWYYISEILEVPKICNIYLNGESHISRAWIAASQYLDKKITLSQAIGHAKSAKSRNKKESDKYIEVLQEWEQVFRRGESIVLTRENFPEVMARRSKYAINRVEWANKN